MKKIVIDGAIFGLQKTGGISTLWRDILLGLDPVFARENRIFLLIPSNSNYEWKELSSQLKNIKIRIRKRFKWGHKNYFNSIYLTYLALKWRPDVWHESYYVGFPLFFGGKKVTTFHDMIPEKQGCVVPYDHQKKYHSLKKCSQAIAISQHSQQDLAQIWPEFAQKSMVIHNGASTNPLSLKKEKTILFVGKRRGYKNFLSSVRALLNDSRFDEHKIVAVGGEAPLDADEIALKGRVDFVGHLTARQMQEQYAKATFVLFPSLYEGFGLPLIEAFASNCLVIAARASVIPEIVGEEYPLFDSNNSVADVAARLLSEKEKWISYGQKRRELFSVEKMVQNIANFYDKLI